MAFHKEYKTQIYLLYSSYIYIQCKNTIAFMDILRGSDVDKECAKQIILSLS